MRVRVAVAFIMNSKIGNHASNNKIFFNKIARDFYIFMQAEFNRQCHINTACGLCVLAFFGKFNDVPKRGAVCIFYRRVFGKHNFGMHNASFECVIVCYFILLILQFLTGIVCCRTD
jgi:hypothetical protein